jgi:hypothetical protein
VVKSQLATFRLNPDAWEEFQKYARKQGLTATALLVGFIDSCLAGDDCKPADTANINPQRNNSHLYEDIYILQARLASLELRLNSLDANDKFKLR